MKELEGICNPIIAKMYQGADADMAGGMDGCDAPIKMTRANNVFKY
jgi:heat shock 70kDa protein 1/2/6/8